jgi:VanZ family protein
MTDRLRVTLLALWPVMIAVVIVFSLLPGSAMPRLPMSDTQEHLTAYFGLALVPAAALKRWWRALAAATAMACLGLALEFFQLKVPGRAFELRDILANCVGVAVGTLAGWPLRRWMIRPG